MFWLLLVVLASIFLAILAYNHEVILVALRMLPCDLS